MPDPVTFDSASARFGLPFLYSGQAQKEVFVNEAFATTDTLLHCKVEDEAGSPPRPRKGRPGWLRRERPATGPGRTDHWHAFAQAAGPSYRLAMACGSSTPLAARKTFFLVYGEKLPCHWNLWTERPLTSKPGQRSAA